MKKTIVWILALVLVISLFAGCAANTASETTAAPDASQSEADKETESSGKFKIGICAATAVNSWMVKENELLEYECSQDTDQFEYTLSVGENAAQQQDIIETYLNGDYDLIMVMPQDASALQEVLDRVYDSGIPLVIATRPVSGDKYTTHIGGSDYACGAQAADYFGDVLGGEGKVAVMRCNTGEEEDLLRYGGFADTLAEKYPGIEIVCEADPSESVEKGYEHMTDMLAAYDEIDGVYCEVDEVGLGVEQAIRNSGRTDCRYIIGIGGAKEIFDMMKEPDAIYTAITTFLPTSSQLSLQYAKKILLGESVEKEILDPCVLVTAANVDEYYDLGY